MKIWARKWQSWVKIICFRLKMQNNGCHEQKGSPESYKSSVFHRGFAWGSGTHTRAALWEVQTLARRVHPSPFKTKDIYYREGSRQLRLLPLIILQGIWVETSHTVESQIYTRLSQMLKRNLILCLCSGVNLVKPEDSVSKYLMLQFLGTWLFPIKTRVISPKATVCSICHALETLHVPFVHHCLASFLLISSYCMIAFFWLCPISLPENSIQNAVFINELPRHKT